MNWRETIKKVKGDYDKFKAESEVKNKERQEKELNKIKEEGRRLKQENQLLKLKNQNAKLKTSLNKGSGGQGFGFSMGYDTPKPQKAPRLIIGYDIGPKKKKGNNWP